MFKATCTPWAPWHVVRSDDKNRARLNAISHFLSQIPYQDPAHEKPIPPKRRKPHGYKEPNYPYKVVPELEWREISCSWSIGMTQTDTRESSVLIWSAA